jgi:hypothetical protein
MSFSFSVHDKKRLDKIKYHSDNVKIDVEHQLIENVNYFPTIPLTLDGLRYIIGRVNCIIDHKGFTSTTTAEIVKNAPELHFVSYNTFILEEGNLIIGRKLFQGPFCFKFNKDKSLSAESLSQSIPCQVVFPDSQDTNQYNIQNEFTRQSIINGNLYYKDILNKLTIKRNINQLRLVEALQYIFPEIVKLLPEDNGLRYYNRGISYEEDEIERNFGMMIDPSDPLESHIHIPRGMPDVEDESIIKNHLELKIDNIVIKFLNDIVSDGSVRTFVLSALIQDNFSFSKFYRETLPFMEIEPEAIYLQNTIEIYLLRKFFVPSYIRKALIEEISYLKIKESTEEKANKLINTEIMSGVSLIQKRGLIFEGAYGDISNVFDRNKPLSRREIPFLPFMPYNESI